MKAWLPRAAAALVAAALLGLPAWGARISFPDVPPAQHTGGFGEPTCHACHFDNHPDPSEGLVELAGLPAAYQPGQSYPVTVKVARPGMKAAGFELSTRFSDGESSGHQAGDLTVDTARAALTRAGTPEVVYAHHTREGTALIVPDTALWTVVWRAPDRVGVVTVHLVVNAANGDASQFGDHIYARAYAINGHPLER